jgi:hypothetical protein
MTVSPTRSAGGLDLQNLLPWFLTSPQGKAWGPRLSEEVKMVVKVPLLDQAARDSLA